MEKTNQGMIINGVFAVIVAIISLIGGLLLKDPIQKAISKQHCKMGGVWKPHEDLLQSCNVNQLKDTFYISMQASFNANTTWIISGKGYEKDGEGKFSGDLNIVQYTDAIENTVARRENINIDGIVNMQGCDELGVTILDAKDASQVKTFAFVREITGLNATPEKNEKE